MTQTDLSAFFALGLAFIGLVFFCFSLSISGPVLPFLYSRVLYKGRLGCMPVSPHCYLQHYVNLSGEEVENLSKLTIFL